MSELKPRIKENGIDYILVGDYYIPDLKLDMLSLLLGVVLLLLILSGVHMKIKI